MQEHAQKEEEFDIKKIFIPFTTIKAIHWIVIIGLVVFANMLFNGFVWDDKAYILFNSDILTSNFSTIIGPNLFNSVGQYRPISDLYFTLAYILFHNVTFFYHLTQLLIHITNTVIVFLLLKKFFNKQLSFFLSLIFLIHPVQVEAVSYIAAADNPLYFLFGILALFLSSKEKTGQKRLLFIFGLILLSSFTNETGFLFLFSILLYRVLFTKNNRIHFFIYGIATTIFYFIIRFVVGKVYFTKLVLLPIGRLSFIGRLVNIPEIVFYYLKTFFYPAQLIIDQQWIVTKITFKFFYLPLIVDLFCMLFIIGFGIYLFRVNKKLFKLFLFFTLLFIAGLGLHSQIFPLDLTVADRWFYFPMLGILGMIGVVLQSFKLFQKPVLYIIYFAAAIVLLLSLRTVVRNTNWSSPITLYTHDATIEDNWDIENNLGAEYRLINDQKDALIHFKKAEAFFPFETTELSVGNTYWNMGNMPMTKVYYDKALSEEHFPPDGHKHQSNTYQNYGELLLVTNQPQTAVKFFKHALSDYPNSQEIWDELAISQSWIHDQKDAIASAKKALMLQSNQRTQYIYEKIIKDEHIKVSPINNGIKLVMRLSSYKNLILS